jgi:hypothetical protein
MWMPRIIGDRQGVITHCKKFLANTYFICGKQIRVLRCAVSATNKPSLSYQKSDASTREVRSRTSPAIGNETAAQVTADKEDQNELNESSANSSSKLKRKKLSEDDIEIGVTKKVKVDGSPDSIQPGAKTTRDGMVGESESHLH